MARRPAVAGMFYDSDRDDLVRSIEASFLGDMGPGKLPEPAGERLGNVLGLVCPHAGYAYSGYGAAYAYNELAKDGIPEIAVLIGPNHYGVGTAVALDEENEWITPLGAVQVDSDTADAVLVLSKYAQRDDQAHSREHSLEVQVPFLQYIGNHRTRIVPISIAYLNEADALELVKDLSNALAGALAGKDAVIIASTDFTHYETKSHAQLKDALAMEQILSLDPEGLIRTVQGRSISMCGAAGTAVMLEASKKLGAVSARKLTYYTSGDVTGDNEQVVGYGAVVVTK